MSRPVRRRHLANRSDLTPTRATVGAKFDDFPKPTIVFSVAGPSVWNSLPADSCHFTDITVFRHHFKTHLLTFTLYFIILYVIVVLHYTLICQWTVVFVTSVDCKVTIILYFIVLFKASGFLLHLLLYFLCSVLTAKCI